MQRKQERRPILPLISQQKLPGRKRVPRGLMRSAELLQQPACGAGDQRRSIRVDDHEPGHQARIDPGDASARLTAQGGVVAVVKGLVHVACFE